MRKVNRWQMPSEDKSSCGLWSGELIILNNDHTQLNHFNVAAFELKVHLWLLKYQIDQKYFLLFNFIYFERIVNNKFSLIDNKIYIRGFLYL